MENNKKFLRVAKNGIQLGGPGAYRGNTEEQTTWGDASAT